MKHTSLKPQRAFTIILTLLIVSLASGLILAFLVKTQQQRGVSELYVQNIVVDLELISATDMAIATVQEKIRKSSQILSQENAPTHLRYRPSTPKMTAASSLLSFPVSVPELLTEGEDQHWTRVNLTDLAQFMSIGWGRIGLNKQDIKTEKGIYQKIYPEKEKSKSIFLQGHIYDLGGLCDANVIPWGSLMEAEDRKYKAYSYSLNPEKITGLNNVEMKRIGQWLAGSGSSDGNTLRTRIKEMHKTGFLTIDNKANVFLSREELLDFIDDYEISSLSTEVLGTFSREINAPSFRPTFNGTTFSTFNASSLYTFKYLEECDDSWSGVKPRKFNRDFTLLPAMSSNKEGISVLSRRFALRKLDLLEKASGTIGVDSEIYRYFGLTRTGDGEPWLYSAGALDESGNTKIYQLNDPAFLALNREPNFFELLQAGILAGSLGQNSKSNDQTSIGEMIFCQTPENEISTPYHIFKIGLNIIDQWDQDSYPTMLQLIGRKVIQPPPDSTNISQEGQVMVLIGQEGLPQISELNYFLFRPPSGSTVRTPVPVSGGVLTTYTQPATLDYIFTWFVPEFWAIENLTTSVVNGPQKFRFSTRNGRSYLIPTLNQNGRTSFHIDYASTPCKMDFNLNRTNVTSPRIADTSVTSVTSTTPTDLNQNGSATIPSVSWFGIPSSFNLAQDYRSTGALLVPAVNPARAQWGFFKFGSGSSNFTFAWSYLKNGKSGAIDSDWQDIQLLQGLLYSNGVANTSPGDAGLYTNNMTGNVANNLATISSPYSTTNPAFSMSFSPVDPRGARVGWTNFEMTTTNTQPSPNTHPWFGMNTAWQMLASLWGNPTGALFFPFNITSAKSNSWWTVNTSVVDYVDNRSTGVNPHSSISTLRYYKDNDGIVRRGDGNANYGVYPNRPDTDLSARPIILNRAFKNIAEMGYAYRDLPWKTIDFASGNSGDRALLDLFTLEEEPEVVAGKINFHSASKEILQALLDGTEIDPLSGSTLSNSSGINASTVVDSLFQLKEKVENKSDLVTQMITALPESNQLDTAIKWRRESTIRALIPSVQTRTWNLCLDLNCQVATLQKNSQEKGSRARVWVSVAIDRFTGHVVDRQVEWIQ